jgi:hypothetical protein
MGLSQRPVGLVGSFRAGNGDGTVDNKNDKAVLASILNFVMWFKRFLRLHKDIIINVLWLRVADLLLKGYTIRSPLVYTWF